MMRSMVKGSQGYTRQLQKKLTEPSENKSLDHSNACMLQMTVWGVPIPHTRTVILRRRHKGEVDLSTEVRDSGNGGQATKLDPWRTDSRKPKTERLLFDMFASPAAVQNKWRQGYYPATVAPLGAAPAEGA